MLLAAIFRKKQDNNPSPRSGLALAWPKAPMVPSPRIALAPKREVAWAQFEINNLGA